MPDTTCTPDRVRTEFLQLTDTSAEPWQTPALQPATGRPEKPSAATANNGAGAIQLLKLLQPCPLFIDPHGGTYIKLEDELYPLESKNQRLVETASDMFYQATGKKKTMSKDSLSAAVAILSRRARLEGEVVEMANRAVRRGDALYYELDPKRVVKISAGNWQLEATRPGMFNPWPHKRPHPEPLNPGDATRLFEFVNVPAADRPLVLATLAACMVPAIARPALVITGPQGSGKSTAARFFKMLLDPGTPALTLVPRKPDDLDLLLTRTAFLALDNLSALPPEVADTLSGVITGAVPQRRKLHTDSQLITLHADISLCFTSISNLSERPDFMERTLRVQLERIADDTRLTDDELDTAFTLARPGILGGLLSMLARGLALLPNYRPARLPRMSEFARLGAAIAEANAADAGEQYLAELVKNQRSQQLELADGNLLYGAIQEACANGNYPEGTFKEVVGTLRRIAEPGPKDPFPTSRGFRNALERLRVPLRTAGIEYKIDNQRTATHKAYVRFFKRESQAE